MASVSSPERCLRAASLTRRRRTLQFPLIRRQGGDSRRGSAIDKRTECTLDLCPTTTPTPTAVGSAPSCLTKRIDDYVDPPWVQLPQFRARCSVHPRGALSRSSGCGYHAHLGAATRAIEECALGMVQSGRLEKTPTTWRGIERTRG